MPAAAPAPNCIAFTPDGKGKVLADLDALEIHAIAIDSRDRVYAATSPDGKVYRIAGNGKPEVFYDPKAKYIWALAFDAAGDLFVATGDQGELHRVTPDGKGTRVFQDRRDAHSLARHRRQGQPDPRARNPAAWCCASRPRARASSCTRCRNAK